MTDPLVATLHDDAIVALTLFGEARGEGPEGRIAVANVIRNRAAIGGRLGATFRDVCLKPYQFSCWIPEGGTLNYGVLMDAARLLATSSPIGPVLRECRWIARGLFASDFVDNTHGASHYLTSQLLATTPPSWAVGQKVLAVIGRHSFLRVP